MRQVYGRPVPLAVAPVTATTPGYHGNWPYGLAFFMSGPTLEKRRSRRREPDYRQLGTAAYQGKALVVEVSTAREVNTTRRIFTPSM